MEQIETVGDLIAALENYDPATPIQLASQPGWPFECTVGGVALTPDDADHHGTAPADEPVVWIGEGRQVGYLSGVAANALGWSQ
jgi:hypothetical protein